AHRAGRVIDGDLGIRDAVADAVGEQLGREVVARADVRGEDEDPHARHSTTGPGTSAAALGATLGGGERGRVLVGRGARSRATAAGSGRLEVREPGGCGVDPGAVAPGVVE